MSEIGLREKAVRSTLASRPAGIIDSASRAANSCFAGLFNGAKREGSLRKDGGLFIGKAECEWDWRETWAELRDLGLIEWSIEKRTHPGGEFEYLVYQITDKGWEVRKDDLAYFHALIDAEHADAISPTRSE